MRIAMFRVSLVFALMLLPAMKLPAQELRDPQFMEQVRAIFSDMFNLDYDKAKQELVLLEKKYPDHPAPPLYLASIYWLEEMVRRQDLSLNRFISPAYFDKKTDKAMPPEARKAFFQNLQKSEDLSNAILKKNRSDKDGRYFLATAYGLRASFAITVDHSLKDAFRAGDKAYSYATDLMREDPDYHDAYLIGGTYEYVAGSIPWYLKWISAIIGFHGSKKEGMAQLKIAAEKGQYVRNEATLVLMVLYVREHRYAEALNIAQSLNRRFPRNFLFAINVAQIEQLSGQKDEAVAMLLNVEKRAEEGEPNFNRLPLQAFRFSLATELLNMGKLDLAQERFRKCLENPQLAPAEKVRSHLSLARILDWKHQPAESAEECRKVLALPDVDDSHDRAKGLLKKLDR
jgi:hypothetical protein